MTTPRIVLYYQTFHRGDVPCASLLPLLTPPARLTHLIVAAFHIIESDPDHIRLNNDPPSDPRFATLWAETAELRRRGGVRIMAMLGGAAPGCFCRATLDAPARDVFMRYYAPLRDMLRQYGFDGIDLDVEEEMSLPGIIRLIDALRADMGPDFIITLAPVAAALVDTGNMSGFNYFDLEDARGAEIAWYNAQFYNGWGGMPLVPIVLSLWGEGRVVVGQLTNPLNGNGYVPLRELRRSLDLYRAVGGRVSGIMGWEYFNALPLGELAPWMWAAEINSILGVAGEAEGGAEAEAEEEGEAPVPGAFEYHSNA